MGLFDKVKFWKRGDDLGLKDNVALGQGSAMPRDELGLHGMDQQSPFGMQQQQMPTMDSMDSTRAYAANKDMEVISAKLDALKAAIESLNQRLANMERMMGGDQNPPTKREGWY
ncbi:MAG: hypothetical protein GY861_27695 [bacterium]|nr:hypothetical protein [bacterium]